MEHGVVLLLAVVVQRVEAVFRAVFAARSPGVAAGIAILFRRRFHLADVIFHPFSEAGQQPRDALLFNCLDHGQDVELEGLHRLQLVLLLAAVENALDEVLKRLVLRPGVPQHRGEQLLRGPGIPRLQGMGDVVVRRIGEAGVFFQHPAAKRGIVRHFPHGKVHKLGRVVGGGSEYIVVQQITAPRVVGSVRAEHRYAPAPHLHREGGVFLGKFKKDVGKTAVRLLLRARQVDGEGEVFPDGLPIQKSIAHGEIAGGGRVGMQDEAALVDLLLFFLPLREDVKPFPDRLKPLDSLLPQTPVKIGRAAGCFHRARGDDRRLRLGLFALPRPVQRFLKLVFRFVIIGVYAVFCPVRALFAPGAFFLIQRVVVLFLGLIILRVEAVFRTILASQAPPMLFLLKGFLVLLLCLIILRVEAVFVTIFAGQAPGVFFAIEGFFVLFLGLVILRIKAKFRAIFAGIAPAVLFLFEGFLVLLLSLVILRVETKFRAVLAGLAPAVLFLFKRLLVLLLGLVILRVETKFGAILAGLPPGVFLLAFLKNLQGAPPLAQVALAISIEVQKVLFIPLVKHGVHPSRSLWRACP